MSADSGGERQQRLGRQPLPFGDLCLLAVETGPRLARPMWSAAAVCYLPLAVVCAVGLTWCSEESERWIGVLLAYQLLSGAATFLCQVQVARYVAKDRAGQPLHGDCGAWWRRHLPGVVQSLGATFVALCGVYAALYLVFVTLALLIGFDNEVGQWLLGMIFGYTLWFSDAMFRAMALLVAPLAGLALAFGWNALGRSFELMRAAIRRRSEFGPFGVAIELVVVRVAAMFAGAFEGSELVAFVLFHGLLSVAVRPVVSMLQTFVLIDALGQETPLDEEALGALLAGAGEPR